MSKFDDAVRESLKAGQDYQAALQDLDDLTRELDESVRKATGGAVMIDCEYRGAQGRRQRADIVARGSETRGLWEVVFSSDGYPVKVIAPDDSVILCVTRTDLEDTFDTLLRQGTTGRLLRLLQGPSQQASEVDTLQ